ncbi:HAD family hydrolase [Parabacteroides sp. OttesenSCG-928-G07]|nr:HAD family hydrolase [Parabacteroides sp. OttesenSCG-928-G21]MDL2277437.1 HAD family hydrolase [Parabacteroides sp. OttesenSCG-928-G07]
MINPEEIKGLLFDYGGTIDSNGMHWAEVIWMAYEAEGIGITKPIFREAYVYGERTLGKNRIVLPHHNFFDMLNLKMGLQFDYLKQAGILHAETDYSGQQERLAEWCYNYARQSIDAARPILEQLATRYKMVLVSNFYGNIESVLDDFDLHYLFREIVESAVVGIRKPDPAIFSLGLDKLALKPEETVVIGDSYDKDIIPARTIGCRTIWLKSIGWQPYKGDETADAIISDFQDLRPLFNLE